MSSKGLNLAEETHVVPILYPVSGSTTSDIINMEGYQHASIIVVQGVGASAITMTVRGSDDNASSTTSAISFQYYSEVTASTDVLGARTSGGASTGFDMTSGSSQFCVIEVDASELPSGQSFMLLEMESSENLVGVTAVLSGARYAKESSPSVQ